MADTIVYTTVSNGGGVDGMDHTDKGGRVMGAYLDKKKAINNPNAPWNTVVPIVVDIEELAKTSLAKLDPVVRLAIEYHFLNLFGK
jgi:hypothetical protein